MKKVLIECNPERHNPYRSNRCQQRVSHSGKCRAEAPYLVTIFWDKGENPPEPDSPTPYCAVHAKATASWVMKFISD